MLRQAFDPLESFEKKLTESVSDATRDWNPKLIPSRRQLRGAATTDPVQSVPVGLVALQMRRPAKRKSSKPDQQYRAPSLACRAGPHGRCAVTSG
jgi:hypothetical protein